MANITYLVLGIIGVIYLIFAIWTLVDIIKNKGGAGWLTFGILNILFGFSIILVVPALVIMILWWANKHNRMESKEERKQLRQVQIDVLKKARASTEIKGKMRRLK